MNGSAKLGYCRETFGSRSNVHVKGVLSTYLVALVGVGFVGALWWTAPDHGVGWSGYERIELGMTESEVEEIIRRPPGWYEPLPVGEHQVYVHEASAEKGV